jgi:8-oxo-dGTP diphosphatase
MSQLRQNTGVAIIFRSGDKIAFVCRKNTGWYDNYYGLPGGKVEPGESFTHAAIREINEEVGVAVTASNL